MTLPTLAKTWYFNVNNQNTTGASATATCQKLLRLLKDNLVGGTGTWTDSTGGAVTPSNWWTVSGSCDGSTSGMDGVDRWTTDAKVLWVSPTTAAGSWIVLRQPQLSTKFEILLFLPQSGTNIANITMYVSPVAGFGTVNGGTDGAVSGASNRPTATDEILMGTGAAWGVSTINSSSRWHILRSSDAKHWRIFICRNGFTTGFCSMEHAGSPVSGWATPGMFAWVGLTTDPATVSLATPANYSVTARHKAKGNSSMSLAMTGEGIRTTTSASILLPERVGIANDLSGEFPLFPIGLASATGSNEGRHGTMVDMWWGLTSLAESTTYPNDGSRQMVHFGNFVNPWNGSVPIFT